MTFDSPALLGRLQRLQRQIAEALRYGEALRAWRGSDRPEAWRAALDAERDMRALVATTIRIKAQLVPVDGLGDAFESLSELVLRGVRMVVIGELAMLRDLACDSSDGRRSRTLRWGRFWGIEDLSTCVHTDLARITDQWRRYCGTARIERAAYRAALRAAHASMRELGTTSEFARFLDEGLIRADWPELQAVCARSRASLAIPMDVEPDTPVLIVAWPARERAAERAS